jgi:hypothetical protein
MKAISTLLLLLLGGAAGIGGLKAYQTYLAPAAPTLMEELQEASGSPAPDSTGAVVAQTPDTVTVAMDTAAYEPALPAHSSEAPMLAGADSVPAAIATAAAASRLGPEERLEPRRLAKLFGAMQAREAARVLERMSDSDIQVVLNQLADRQAAGILSNLSPERAAQLTQVVLRGERSPQ